MVRLKRKRKIDILFFILLVEISTHAVFIIYFNTFFPLSNFEYGTVSRYSETCAVSNKASARSFCELRRELEPRPCDQSRQRPTRRDRNNAWWHAPPKENNTRVSCVIGRKGSNETPFTRAILFL